MSSRALRKMGGKDNDILGPTGDDDQEEDSLVFDVRSSGGAKPKMANPFNLLNNDSCSESEVKEDDDVGTESAKEKTDGAPVGRGGGGVTGGGGGGKKKKGKGNRKTRPAFVPKSSEDNLEFDDEVARSVREVDKILGTTPTAATEAGSRRTKSGHSESETSAIRTLTSVEPKNLNPENEMKKIFGSRVVLADVQRHNRRGSRTRAVQVRHHWLIVPKPSWPNPGKTGLTMKFLEADEQGNQLFTFEHSKEYQAVQQQFVQAVDSMQPDYIVQILNRNPYHIDSMLQLSEICKMGEDSQMATELIERTLFAMEAAFHPLFNLSVGISRLDYRRQENRAFYLALYRHMTYVGSRACYRTALELSKVIINLDPVSDPLGVILIVDFFALRSNQHNWLIRVYNEWESTKNLSQLPNMAYSIAVAKFQRANQKDVRDTKEAGAAMAEADSCLKYALTMFPSALLPLLDKCGIEADAKAATSPFFLEGHTSKGLEILVGMYVHRSYHIWKDPALLPWLERNVNSVLEDVQAQTDLVKDCATKRKARYQGTPKNILRHVIISDVKEVASSLPRSLSETAILSYDPLPPSDSIDTYSYNGGRPGSGGSRSAGESTENTLRMFLRSLLPNYDPNDPSPVLGAAGGEGEGEGDLRGSVTTLLDAMQNLLGGLHLPELPNDGAASASDENDNEPFD